MSSNPPTFSRPLIKVAPLQDEGHHDIVRHHDRECDRFHDHHRGCSRKPADESGDRQQLRPPCERERQNEHVTINLAVRECQQAGHRDRHHEQIDQHEVEWKEPGRAPDLAFIVVLDHRDVELAGQQNDREY